MLKLEYNKIHDAYVQIKTRLSSNSCFSVLSGNCRNMLLFADNFDSIISEFSNELGCNSNCIDVINHVTTNTLLVVSLLIFTLVPTVIERMKIIDDIRVYHAEKWHWAIIKDTGHALALIDN